MSDNDDKPEGEEIQWIFSSPVKTVFAGIFIITTIIRLITANALWDWGMVIGMMGYCVFMVLDRRE